VSGGRDVRDAELEELFDEPDDREFAQFLRSVPHEPVEADPAFKMALRRRLMEEAWKLKEPRLPWYRRLLGPPALAWSGALAGVLLILFATLTLSHSSRGGVQEVTVASPLDRAQAVSVAKPITLEFSQPMNQRATQQAVEVHPATQVAYRWSSPRTLEVTPQNGSLAPGTRYDVTVTPAARTATNQQLGKPATMTFVTAQATPAAPATPAPAPSPSRPPSQLLDAHQVGPAGPPPAVWSLDGSQLYVVGPAGQLSAYPSGGSVAQPIADRDVRLVTAGPQGPAYARGQDLVYGSLTLSGANPSAIGFQGSQLVYLQGQSVMNGQPGLLAPNGTKIAELDRPPTAASFAPDGSRLAYLTSDGLHLVDVSAGKDQLVGPATVLGDWSADASRFAYANGSTVLETSGGTPTPVLSVAGVNSIDWSGTGQLLLSGTSGLSVASQDGKGLRQVAPAGTAQGSWSPAGNAVITYRQGSAAWTARVGGTQPAPTSVDSLVSDFMNARKAGDSQKASAYLDDAGKKAFQSVPLVYSGQPQLDRFQVLVSQPSGLAVVRLVLANGSTETVVDETLILQRDGDSGRLLVHAASDTRPRSLDTGPEVLSVNVSGTRVTVTFDSDLDPATVQSAVTVPGQNTQASYNAQTRTVTLTVASPLQAGNAYTVRVSPQLRDVGHRPAATQSVGFNGPGTAKATAPPVVPSPSSTPPPLGGLLGGG
jgi:hypothetical protein